VSDIYVARENAIVQYDNAPLKITKGVHRVRAGHDLLDLYPDLFEPITVHFDIGDTEQATARPGERRGRKRKTDE